MTTEIGDMSFDLDNPLGSKLVKAVRNGDESECERLIKLGADINYIHYRTSLLCVCFINISRKYNFNVVKMLVEAGCNVNYENCFNVTPLMVAITYGYFEACEYLLQNGANINMLDNRNQTALHYVCFYKYKKDRSLYKTNEDKLKLCALLIDYGVDVLTRDLYNLLASDSCNYERDRELYDYLKQKEAERKMLNVCFKRAQIVDDDTDDGEPEENIVENVQMCSNLVLPP